jgi:Putative restriction endonuclease
MILIEEEIPTLTNGEKLSKAEFMRRWEACPNINRAELIGGRVYMPTPVGYEHSDSEGQVGTWLGVYAATTPGCASGHSATTYLLDDIPQPDLNLRILADWGGASWVEGKYLHGAPELLVEISHSSIFRDLTIKRDLYQKASVKEYLIVLLADKEVHWHYLKDGSYQLLEPDGEEVYRSLVFPGLWLDSKALLQGRMSQVLATLQKGMASQEYVQFIAELNSRKK